MIKNKDDNLCWNLNNYKGPKRTNRIIIIRIPSTANINPKYFLFELDRRLLSNCFKLGFGLSTNSKKKFVYYHSDNHFKLYNLFMELNSKILNEKKIKVELFTDFF